MKEKIELRITVGGIKLTLAFNEAKEAKRYLSHIINNPFRIEGFDEKGIPFSLSDITEISTNTPSIFLDIKA